MSSPEVSGDPLGSWDCVVLHGEGLFITDADGCEKPGKAKRWKPLEPSLEPPEGVQLFSPLSFSPGRPVVDVWP